MCGRFSLFADLSVLEEKFQFTFEESYHPRYNVAPSQNVLTVIQQDKKRIGKWMRWGLIPFWAKEKKIGYKLINARAETVAEKPSFRHAFRQQRCLILADGFYEWKKSNGQKKPYRFQLKNNEVFAFAGLWDDWKKDGEKITSCTLITTYPNKLAQTIHDRMPVILPPDAYDIWLDPNISDQELLYSFLKPYPEDQMEVYPVSTLVNSPKNDHPSILQELE